MKKKLFSCFHPLVLESETNPTVSSSIILPNDHNQKGLQISNAKRPFSQVLEILLLKASLKMKVSERNRHKLSLETKSAKLRRICRRMQISGHDRTRRYDKGAVEEAKVSHTEVRSSVTSSSSYDTKNTKLPRSRRDGLEFGLMTKPCSCKISHGLCLLVVTLFFTVFWGRVRAVVLALVFLYLFPFWAGFLR